MRIDRERVANLIVFGVLKLVLIVLVGIAAVAISRAYT